MKKSGAFLFIFAMLMLGIVHADSNETSADSIQKAYQCLTTEVNAKSSSSLSLQEATFSILALGSNTKAAQKIEDEKSGNNCWPKTSCKIKETAQGLLAYEKLGKDTGAISTYLLSKNGTASDLAWFLLIDISNHEPASCTIKHDSSQNTIAIGDDMKITGNPGSCLSVISSGYWLQISSTCLDKNFEISCTKDFITTLLYKKSNADTIYVSSKTNSAASSGQTQEHVNAKCFKSGADCDYEGSLWAAFALSQAGKDITAFVPYLVAAAQDNPSYFPSAFIYKLTGGQDQYSEIVSSQQSNQFWSAPSTKYNKYYDTALGLLALQGKDAQEATNAKNYLISIQSSDGCWNSKNIRDTAFILYGGWSEQNPTTPHSSSGTLCTEGGFFCESSALQCQGAGGEILTNYECPSTLYCCSKPVATQTCAQQQGSVCTSGEQCSGLEVDSSDGTCCLAQCQPVQTDVNECEQSGNTCRSACNSDEQANSLTCTFGSDICCELTTSSGSSNWWIVLLIILILLVIAAIIFRNRLKILFFKSRKSSSTPITIRRPPFSPASPPRLMTSPRSASMPSRRPTVQDKEMEDTLRKLREMSK